MTRQKLTAMLAVTGLMAGLTFGGPHEAAASDLTALADPRPSPVISIEVSVGELIAKTSDESYSFDGTYKNARGGQWVEFAEGKAVSISDDKGRKAEIQKTTIQGGGKVVFVTGSGEVSLGRGKYERQEPTQPPEPPHDPQPRPNPNAFEIKDGGISSVWIGGSI